MKRHLFALWLWAVERDCCLCRLGPLGRRACHWIDRRYWRDLAAEDE